MEVLIRHQSGQGPPDLVVVQRSLGTEQDKDEPDRYIHLQDVVEEGSLGQTDKRHGGLLQKVQGPDQDGGPFRSQGDSACDLGHFARLMVVEGGAVGNGLVAVPGGGLVNDGLHGRFNVLYAVPAAESSHGVACGSRPWKT